jgi:hypothetical protein
MEGHMQRFHGTAARQLVLIEKVQGPEFKVQSPRARVQGPPRIRLMQKDMYAELTRRRRRAQIAARHLLKADDKQ